MGRAQISALSQLMISQQACRATLRRRRWLVRNFNRRLRRQEGRKAFMNANVILRRFSTLLSAAVFVLLGALAQAQTHPNLFRQRPVSTSPGGHGLAAQIGDIDEAALTAGPAGLDMVVTGNAALARDPDRDAARRA